MPKKTAKSFEEIFKASWHRVWDRKVALLLPAIMSAPGSLLQMGGNVGGAFDDVEDTAADAAEPLSFIPQVLAEETMSSATEQAPDWLIPLMVGLGIFALLTGILYYVFSVYASLVLYDEHEAKWPTTKRALWLSIPLFGLYIWMFLRTFMWLPLILLIASVALLALDSANTILLAVAIVLSIILMIAFAAYYMPRIGLANVIFIKERTRINEAVNLSFKRTQGYYWKIVGNNLLFGICLMVIFIAVTISVVMSIGIGGIAVVALVAWLDSLWLLVPVLLIGALCFLAMLVLNVYVQYWQKAFHYELAMTVFTNPRKAPKK